MTIIHETNEGSLMARSLDRFELMRLFVRISETGSLSAAGRSLGLSQPSASRQLRNLESELGVQLIMRTTHDLSFTEAGEEFLKHAQQLLAGWETAVEEAGSGLEQLQGRIRVAAPTGLGQTALADLAGSFVKKHPLVTFDWRVVDEPGDMIAEGIDVWVRVGPISDESLIVRSIWTIERVIVSAQIKDFEAKHPKDLNKNPAVILGPYVGSHIELTSPEGENYTLEPNAIISTDNLFTANRLTQSGYGYSILPLWLVDEAIDLGEIRIVCAGWHPPPLQLSMAYPQTRYRPARVREFVSHIRQELPIVGRGVIAHS